MPLRVPTLCPAARRRQIFPGRLSDVMVDHICAQNLLTNKVMPVMAQWPPTHAATYTTHTVHNSKPLAGRASQPVAAVVSCHVVCQRAEAASNRRSWGMLIQEPARVASPPGQAHPGTALPVLPPEGYDMPSRFRGSHFTPTPIPDHWVPPQKSTALGK